MKTKKRSSLYLIKSKDTHYKLNLLELPGNKIVLFKSTKRKV